jgi:hypothetical protein
LDDDKEKDRASAVGTPAADDDRAVCGDDDDDVAEDDDLAVADRLGRERDEGGDADVDLRRGGGDSGGGDSESRSLGQEGCVRVGVKGSLMMMVVNVSGACGDVLRFQNCFGQSGGSHRDLLLCCCLLFLHTQ